MKLKAIVWRVVQLALVLVLLSLLAGQLLGQPLLLSFVETGSMEPTLSPGDGFVALPTELTGTPEEGDVIVFEATEIQGGGLTTHRIVGETDRGYETAGDANPFTDQDGGEPHVSEAEVLAVAWQPGDSVLAIPYVGDAVTGVQSGLESVQLTLARTLGTDTFLGWQGIAYLLFAGSVLFYLLDLLLASPERASRSQPGSRSTTRGTSNRRIVVTLMLVVLAGVTAAMVIPGGTDEFTIVSAEFESDSPDVIEQGTSETIEYEVGNDGLFPMVTVFETSDDNIAVEDSELQLSGRTTEQTNLTLAAPPETGAYQLHLEERRYIGVLPSSVLLGLYEVHPWLPILALNLLVGIPFYVLGMAFLGPGRTTPGTRGGPSILDHLRARLP